MYRLTIEHYTRYYEDRSVTTRYASTKDEVSSIVEVYEEHPRTIAVTVASGSDAEGWRMIAQHDGMHS